MLQWIDWARASPKHVIIIWVWQTQILTNSVPILFFWYFFFHFFDKKMNRYILVSLKNILRFSFFTTPRRPLCLCCLSFLWKGVNVIKLLRVYFMNQPKWLVFETGRPDWSIANKLTQEWSIWKVLYAPYPTNIRIGWKGL